MKLVVIGVGYIGLPAACLFAKSGVDTVGISRSKEKVNKINQGIAPFEEPSLSELLREVLDSKKFECSSDLEGECSDADAVIICVPTPLKNKGMDDTALVEASERVINSVRKDVLIVIESTVAPGTTYKIGDMLKEKGWEAGKDFYLAHCPERAIPGRTIYEMVHNDRVIGGINEESTEKAVELYSKMVKGEIFKTDAVTAEIVKLSENTFRDVNIALANELAMICEFWKVNVYDVIRFANRHPRVNIHLPGSGVGGHCLPIDPWFLTEQYSKAEIIPVSRKINDSMPEHMVRLAVQLLDEYKIKLSDAKIAVFGVAYKKDVNDTRETPAKKVVELLRERGANVVAYDPLVKECDFVEVMDLRSAVEGSDAILIVIDHTSFKNIEWNEIGEMMRTRNIIDGRNLIDKLPNFRMKGIGRGDLKIKEEKK